MTMATTVRSMPLDELTVTVVVDNDTIVATPKVFVRDAVVDESAGIVTVPVVVTVQ